MSADVELICNHRRSGKTTTLCRLVDEELAAGRRATLVVPEWPWLNSDPWRRRWRECRVLAFTQGTLHQMRGLDGTGETLFVEDAHLFDDGLGSCVDQAGACRYDRVVATYTPDPRSTLELLARLEARTLGARADAAARRAAYYAKLRGEWMVHQMRSALILGDLPPDGV